MSTVTHGGKDNRPLFDKLQEDRLDRGCLAGKVDFDDLAFCLFYEWKEKHKLADQVKVLKTDLKDATELNLALQDERDRLHATSLQAVQQADRARAIAGWAVAALIIGSVIGWFW